MSILEVRVRRRWKLAIGLLAACVGVWAVDAWRLRATWRQARGEVAAGKFATALPRLVGLAGRWPADGEVLYHLGSCELALGRREEAVRAFSRVPRDSPFAGRAAVMRARLALQYQRLSVAEELMPAALEDDGPHAIEARETLIHIYKLQGRYDEARRLVRDGWTRYPDRVGTLQELARLDTATPIGIDKVGPTLKTAFHAAPKDDRVWLGWANLATRTGRFAEARKWLDACLAAGLTTRPSGGFGLIGRGLPRTRSRSRPWLTSRRPLATQSSTHAPRLVRSPGRRCRSRAKTLETLMARDRGEIWAIERLAELLLRAGRPAEAERLRVRKGELEQTLDWYLVHIFPSDRLDYARELARAAEMVGRVFEARCWWELAADRPIWASESREQIARLDRVATEAGPSPTSPTPSELVAELESCRPADAGEYSNQARRRDAPVQR